MTAIIHNWKRFWCERGGTFNASDGGYLTDPDSEYGRLLNPNALAFESISAKRCLVLLGEPGLGKTFSLEQALESVRAEAEVAGATLFHKNLRSYGEESRLVREVFESREILTWLDGSDDLYLFLDSFDEARMRIDTLSSILEERLERCPAERLHLRIACRTAEWPTSLESGLRKRWGEGLVGVYELLPLRERDVEQAALDHALDPERFLAEINRVGVVPLAAKPITLRFLFRHIPRDERSSGHTERAVLAGVYSTLRRA